MAEAVRPDKSKSKTKPSTTTPTSNDTTEIQDNREINDDYLEKRLKSLRSFVNNIEPSPKTNEPSNENQINHNQIENLEQPSTSSNSNAYYDMISEQAKQKQEETDQLQFQKLIENAKNIQFNAPLTVPTVQTEPIQAQPSVVDFNIDKIKQINKLNFPRLVWNQVSDKQTDREVSIEDESSSTMHKNLLIDDELMRFFERDQLCKELEVYYKCKLIQTEPFMSCIDEFIQDHSILNEFKITTSRQRDNMHLNHRKHEFFELVKDYYDARQLVNKCIRHMNEFKWQCIANQMRTIWSFEKYTIESSGICGDQQCCKHELTSEKAYLNRLQLNKLQQMLYELRINLIKSGLISSQFCSKLAKFKIESYLHDTLANLKKSKQNPISSSNQQNASFVNLNDQLKVLIDILFYFNRKHNKPSMKVVNSSGNSNPNRNENSIYYEIDDSNVGAIATVTQTSHTVNKQETAARNGPDGENEPFEDEDEYDEYEEDNEADANADYDDQIDDLFRADINEWIKILVSLLLNESERARLNNSMAPTHLSSTSNLILYTNTHFDNIFFLVQHLLRSPQNFCTNFSYLLQVPLLFLFNTSSNPNDNNNDFFVNSKCDTLIHLYFDFYLKLFASFSYDIKFRDKFLFIKKKNLRNNKKSSVQQSKQSSTTSGAGNSWEFIDLDGDMETFESVLVDINEDDLIKLYYQIPFNNIYAFLWSYLNHNQTNNGSNDGMESSASSVSSDAGSGEINDLSASKVNGADFRRRYVAMKILSFLDYLCRLSIRTLLIYNRLKYKNFCKLIGKTIKDTIRFANCLNSKFSSELQTHYDNFVKRIFTTIIYSTRVRSIRWTILSQLNIYSLCLRTKWLILSIMCGIDVFHKNFEDIFNNSLNSPVKPKDYIIQAMNNDLEAILSLNSSNKTDETEPNNNKLSDIELISFMRTLHFLINLSKQTGGDEDSYYYNLFSDQQELNLYNETFEFMKCVTKVLFKIGYCFESTRDVCHKEANALLFAITSAHPALIGVVLSEIDTNLSSIGKKALYLAGELPFKKWLSHVDMDSDLFFLERCLLSNQTNTIMFRLAISCIDNLDFKQDTRKASFSMINKWKLKSNINSPTVKNVLEQLNKEFTDLSLVFRVKLSIILFELHSRLTIYNYFIKTTYSFNTTTVAQTVDNYHPPLFSFHESITSRDELNTHYSRLAKDKRLSLVSWIWSTLYKMNLFISIDSPKMIDFLDELTFVYSNTTPNTTNINSYLNNYYKIYLSQQRGDQHELIEMSFLLQQQQQQQQTANSNTDQLHSNTTILSPKCPLECYLRLVYSKSGHDCNHLFENSSEYLQCILSISKKQSVQLQQLSYFMVFDWFENIIYKYSCTPQLINQFRLVKQANLNKLPNILLVIFNPPNAVGTDQAFSSNIIDKYSNKIFKRLNSCSNHESYLHLWIETLISSIRNWHKYKNIVKLIDYLVAYSFNLNQNSNSFVNMDLLEEFISYVRADFGVVQSQSLSNYLQSTNEPPPQTQSNANNGWLPPSISWIGSVVSQTAIQLTGSIVSNINGGYSSGTGDFESNQQQFTYDRRLYKECPYVGFYLSLCEERLESQLSLWITFRSYLLGLSDSVMGYNIDTTSHNTQDRMNSPSYIESCWKKTLLYVNRTHNLNLNFSPQRLMLFKWCERAIDLPQDHPLLVLYWQKFFNIYLDKDFYQSLSSTSSPNQASPVSPQRANNFDLELTMTSTNSNQNSTTINNGFILSPTYKLFTSTSTMNSLLKQMKKQLESTSEYYAYQCTGNNEQNNNPSAPTPNYTYSEFISKLYYAFSLWIDETRLHDPNLYLPALPAHYEPNLLAKIFSKQTDLWLNYVDMNKINFHLSSIIKSNEYNSNSRISSARSTISRQNSLMSLSSKSDLFFTQADRLVQNPIPLTQLNLNFKCSLREKFGPTIDNVLQLETTPASKGKSKNPSTKEEIQLIVSISESLIKNIFKYNKDVINHTLNHMLKLDDKLTNKLLIHLWHNEMCEKYVQVPCSSMLNPMHQCSRPAMVKFVYEVATKRDQFRHEIKENRLNHDKLISNFVEIKNANQNESTGDTNKFPSDDIIKSMVAMNQLIKRLLRNHHIYQQHLVQQQQKHPDKTIDGGAINTADSNNQLLLTRLFYLLIDLYETQMNHPYDAYNPIRNSQVNSSGWTNPNIHINTDQFGSLLNNNLNDPYFSTDSIHLYMFDLIHLIGTNFIQQTSSPSMTSLNSVNISLRKRNQQILLEKIIQKLTSTICIVTEPQTSASGSVSVSSSSSRSSSSSSNVTQAPSSSSSRRNSNILYNLTRNKLSLMSLCAQYVEPDDLDLFNEFYMNILCSVSSILINEGASAANNSAVCPEMADSAENMMSQKFSIILHLLSKFSFSNLNKLLASSNNSVETEYFINICKNFVEININFLLDLKYEFVPGICDTLREEEEDELLQEQQDNYIKHHMIKEGCLKQIIDQCIQNYVSILNINYPFYFEYILKKCLEFSGRPATLKYGSNHLKQFNIILRQNELLLFNNKSRVLSKEKLEKTFEFLREFFSFERTKFNSQKRSFYSHWCVHTRHISDIYSSLFINYLDRFIIKDLVSNSKIDLNSIQLSPLEINELINNQMKIFEKEYDNLWSRLIDLYLIWIDPSSVKEVTTQTLINVKDIYENEIAVVGVRENAANLVTSNSPGAAVLFMFDSFLFTFHTILERFNLFMNLFSNNPNHHYQQIALQLQQNAKNYALNKFFHFYYEQIASNLNSSSSVNDNTLDCYHRCMSKYSSNWFGSGYFEPDYRSINVMSELCWASNNRLVKYLAFDMVSYLDFNKISESYFRKMEIMPIQINDLLKCWLQLLAEFCLRDSIRDNVQFESSLKPIYNQAEILQCWSMLSDTSYAEVVIQRFCVIADYRYAFASRGTDRGLLMSLLKSAAEFYSLADRNSLSCFSSAKRRCYLKAICELLLKPNIQTINTDKESFHNCIMNLLTDIETFSISAASNSGNNDSENNIKNLKHEIQLLIDECLCLISSPQNIKAVDAYSEMFESWLSSSKDSPILVHFINRLSRNYNIFASINSSEKYCCLLELCMEVYFESDKARQNQIDRLGWKNIMDEIEFKLNSINSADPETDLFEFKCLQHSSYLLLNVYMWQRLALFKASYNEKSVDFLDLLIKYTDKIIESFLLTKKTLSKAAFVSRPKAGKEEKFIPVLNNILSNFVLVVNNSNSPLIESKVGESLIVLSNLLTFYGEDNITGQNPINDAQSTGTDFLASITFNILAKKSPLSVRFRFYVRCMAICILKQVIVAQEPLGYGFGQASNVNELFPNLNQAENLNKQSHQSPSKMLYKVRTSGADLFNQSDSILRNNDLSPTTSTSPINQLSSSLPNSTTSSNPLVNTLNQQLKHTTYQFNIMYQTKQYSSQSDLMELANYVNHHLQDSKNSLCLPQVLQMSNYLCSKLFEDKNYLF